MRNLPGSPSAAYADADEDSLIFAAANSAAGNPSALAGGEGLPLVQSAGAGSPYMRGRVRVARDRVRGPRSLARAHGMPLGLRMPDPKWYAGWVTSHQTYVDNVTTSLDLTAAAAFDVRFQQLYGVAAKPLAKLHVVGARVFVPGGSAETIAAKYSLMKRAYLLVTKSGASTKVPLFNAFNWAGPPTYDGVLATVQSRIGPIDRICTDFNPFQVDLATDALSIDFSAATDLAANLDFSLGLLCAVWPSGAADDDSGNAGCGVSGIVTGPVEFSATQETFAGTPYLAVGPRF